MDLAKVKLCVDCEEMWEGNEQQCPRCASKSWAWLSKWVPPMSEEVCRGS